MNAFTYFYVLILVISKIFFIVAYCSKSLNDDILKPYLYKHGSVHSNRQIRDVQSHQFGTSTYETWHSHISEAVFPVVHTKYFVSDVPLNIWSRNNHVYGHYTVLQNPLRTFSVLEAPDNGCRYNRTENVEVTAKMRKCIVAQNGGFFQENGACIGNVYSDGRHIHDSNGVQNAHFGITKNGSLITGYLSSSDIEQLEFYQLIGGVIWLVRNGASYVEEAVKLESEKSETTGTLRYFTDVQSARTAIGHDRDGRIIFVQIDGQTGTRGVNLNGFANFLINQLHVVNAINLDGGGSTTLVLNGTLANYPSDHCADDPMWRCARSVTTIICAHEPDCQPNCQNGVCVEGKCICEPNWVGKSCDVLKCAHHNCSNHGLCSTNGCLCAAGWHGDDCSIPCSSSMYGVNCSQCCLCEHGSDCNAQNGSCSCPPGYTGKLCDQECPLGKYGRDCMYHCHCSESCLCNSKTGECNNTIDLSLRQKLFNVSKCLVKSYWETLHMDKKSNEAVYWLKLCSYAFGGLMISIFFNILFMWKAIFNPRTQTTNNEQKEFSSDLSDIRSNVSSSSDGLSSEESLPFKTSKWKSFFIRFNTGNSDKYMKIENSDEPLEMHKLTTFSSVT